MRPLRLLYREAMSGRWTPLAVAVLMANACSGDVEEPMPECIDLAERCDPLYEPTFDNLFARTLKPTCAQVGGSCHGPDGAKGGLVFDDPDAAYSMLVEGSSARVQPADPACSELVVRTHSPGKPWAMPPGEPLSSQEQCGIRQWVERGALR
jgi:hypothetical protein